MKWARAFLCLAILVCGCSLDLLHAQDEEGADVVTITGRIKHFSYEGGFYGIEGDDGKAYKPLRLESSFQVEGLRVKAKARLIEGELLTHGWGTPIDIIEIKRYHKNNP